MKKILSAGLAVSIMTGLLTFNASAASADIVVMSMEQSAHMDTESVPHATALVNDSGLIDEVSYRQYCEKFRPDIDVDDVIAANRYLVAQQDADTDGAVPYGIGTSMTKLDIAGYFSSQDGTSNSAISGIKNQASLAYLNSNLLYSGDERDTYRHFYWSFQSSRAVGTAATRNFTTNYEYASMTLADYETAYNSALNHWTSLDPENATTFASAEAMAKVLSKRDAIIRNITGYGVFSGIFTADTIQDFHNNRAGRNASSSYVYIDEAYTAVKSTLIQGNAPSDSQWHSVYNSNDWRP